MSLLSIAAFLLTANAWVTGTIANASAAADAGQPEPPRVVHVEPSRFGPVLVVEENGLRILRFGGIDAADQSTISLSDPDAVPMEYIRWAALGLAFVERPREVLVIGLGGGAYPMLVRRAVPTARVEAVELDPAVARVARDWFGLREDRRLRVTIADGATFVARSRQRRDLVLVDAYGPGGIPEALRSARFFDRVLRMLRPGGIAVLNVAVEEPGPEAELLARIGAAFPACALVRTPLSDNVVVFGAARLPPSDGWIGLVDRLQRSGRLPFSLTDVQARLQPCPPPEGTVREQAIEAR